MAMGIDQEIQRRMDAYRGNPQGLQQRYQMSQQLLDLLALQKLKAEKDAVARQMQAQMQQTPGTVAQQMEQEMLGRTKQEVAQQVGGVMQQKARQQQQNMARMAQSGIGALAPQTARMAGGGIVAFQEGGSTNRETLQARRDELRTLLSSRVYGGVDPALVQELKDVEDQLATITSGTMGGAYRQLGAIPTPTPTPISTAAAPEKAGPKGTMADIDDREGPPDLAPGPETRDDGGMAGPRGPQSVISGVNQITAPSIPEQSSRTGEIESGIAALRKQGDPMEQLRGLTGFTDEYMRRGDIRKAGEERARRLAELDRAQMDPETLRRERLMASLIGAAGKSTFGLTGAGAAAGAENTRQQQRIAERQRLVDQMALEREAEKTDIELAKEGLAAGKIGYEQASLNRRAAEDIAMRLGADETKRIVQNAKSQLEALVANQQIDIEAAKDVAAQALQAIKERGNDRRALEKELGDVQRKRADFFKEAMRLAQTNASLTGKPLSNEEQEELEAQALLTANAWANEAGLLESEQRLEQRISALGGNLDVDSLTQISQ